MALHQRARLAEAAQIYQAILRLQPLAFEPLHLLGVIALQTRQPQQSLELFAKAISVNPNVAAAYCNRGLALQALNRFAEALESFDKALAINAKFAEAYSNRAIALSAMGQNEQALASCDKALALKPDYAEAYNNRARALNALKRHAEALASCDRAIALLATCTEAHNNRGIALNALMRHAEAIASYDDAIAARPKYPEAYNNRGCALYNLGRAEEALSNYDTAIALMPDYAAAHNNRGSVLRLLARHAEAAASYDKAIVLNPAYVDALFNKSLLLLAQGRFEEGWPLYEVRKKKVASIARHDVKPQWSGRQDLSGKTILLYAEQGLGDTIQFCRYVPLVAALGARVVLEVPRALTNLLSSLTGVAQVVEQGAALPEFDFQSALMSLPSAFKTTLSTIPAHAPYLACDSKKALAWAQRLGEKAGPRVGLVWSGGLRADQPETWAVNKRRNIPLASLAPLAQPHIAFYSLQKGEPAESELAEVKKNGWDGPEIADLTGELKDFSDTAALINSLDLVISVDTSTAHLAGAMGKPVWILNRFDGCWRWLLERPDSPWYPTARLYRQEAADDWATVIARVTADLQRFSAAHRRPDLPS